MELRAAMLVAGLRGRSAAPVLSSLSLSHSLSHSLAYDRRPFAGRALFGSNRAGARGVSCSSIQLRLLL